MVIIMPDEATPVEVATTSEAAPSLSVDGTAVAAETPPEAPEQGIPSDGQESQVDVAEWMGTVKALVEQNAALIQELTAKPAAPSVSRQPAVDSAPVGLTMDQVKSMSASEINANWPAVQRVLGQTPGGN